MTKPKQTMERLVREEGGPDKAIQYVEKLLRQQRKSLDFWKNVLALLYQHPDASAPDRVQAIRNLAQTNGYIPYTVVEWMDGSEMKEVELMSWPYQEDPDGPVLILARRQVGDPTSITEVDVKTLGDVLYRT